MNEVGPELAKICEAAAQLILPLWRSGLSVTHKADESPVTEADHRAEALILEALRSRFPDIPIISEEDAAQFGTPDAIGPRFFLVDPLDGTKAFVRGDPHFTVNIGLIDNHRPVAGAVACPPTGELWFTSGGQALKRRQGGADQPVRVRPWPAGEALVLISHTMKEETIQALAERYGFDRREAMDSSIKLCRIAEGAADIYPRHGPTMEWDIAAGHAVLAAAGGSVLTPEGQPFLYGKASEGFRNGWFVARGG
ncbi:3'(2'),5'-bisphosphate nucleotidase CysQ [Phenylobacterium sp.]|uniref:3'(2'),5'-bisphosphate nucleotidase CysQ n=1 Tax=Phenylobacterium sp. TaxID=1871053 RepID=UPI002DEC65DF|nr:3'(2'),5'-bisphosphate nucleotidase CysQ [Phenylobacterium sp.]